MNSVAMNASTKVNRSNKCSQSEFDELQEDAAYELLVASRKIARQLRESNVAERIVEIKKIRQRIYQQREQIIGAVVTATGKSRTDALVSEVMGVLDYIDWLVSHGAKAIKDERVSTPLALLGKSSKVYYEPLGVVFIIAPWNYPFHITMTTMLAALLAGNAVIIKSSEVTPLQNVFEKILAASPWLSQCVSVVYGSGETARRVIAQRPDKIIFTGSARTGKKILAQAAELLIPVDLELGGKDAAIIFDDVNIKRTAAGVLWGGMTNAGQSCTSVEIAYIQRTIWDEFVGELVSQCQSLVVNSGDLGDADVGAMTADFQLAIVKKQIDDAVAKGAEVLVGGTTLATEHDACPGYVCPTLITNVTQDMSVIREETFGPVIALVPFDNQNDVVAKINVSEFGLSASVWSKDLSRADNVARALEVGAVSINNVMLTEGNPALPFGGCKQSGFGRVKGVEGLRALVRSKAIIVDKQTSKIEANWYPYTRLKYRIFDQFIKALSSRGWRKWFGFARHGLQLESVAQKRRDEI